VGLGERQQHLPGQLSGGQRQKVAIARALANNPAIVLADEPTGNLDSASGHEVLSALEQVNREQGTCLMLVTHDPNVARRAQRILLMRDGQIVQEDVVGDVYTEDLKVLARSELGRAVLNQKSIEWMETNEEQLLRDLLSRVAK
jgi:ABC-type methionine transport system ATPase subunit